MSFSQVWHPARECDCVRPEHWHRALRGPGFALWERRGHPPLPAHVWHESGLPRHQEDLLLWRLPKVSALYGQMACAKASLNSSQTSTERRTDAQIRRARVRLETALHECVCIRKTHTQQSLQTWTYKFRCVKSIQDVSLLNESQCLEIVSVAPSGGQLAN